MRAPATSQGALGSRLNWVSKSVIASSSLPWAFSARKRRSHTSEARGVLGELRVHALEERRDLLRAAHALHQVQVRERDAAAEGEAAHAVLRARLQGLARGIRQRRARLEEQRLGLLYCLLGVRRLA